MPSLPKNNPKCGASLCLITCMLYSGLPVSSQLIVPKVSFAGCSSLPVSTWNVFRDLRVGNVRFCVQVRLNPVLKKAFQVLKKRFGVHEKRLRCFDEKTSTFSRRTSYQFFIFTLPPFREKTFKSLFSFFRNVSKNLFRFCQINAKLL